MQEDLGGVGMLWQMLLIGQLLDQQPIFSTKLASSITLMLHAGSKREEYCGLRMTMGTGS